MNRIKELREAKGLSQDKLSQELNINLRTIQRWENGETAIRRNNAEKIADFFGVSDAYLLGYDIGTKPVKDILGNSIPAVELQGYDYTVLDINQDIPETLNEVSKLKYCVIKLIKENDAPLFTGFRAIITDHDREIVIDPITVDTFFDAFSRTDILIKHGYQSGSPEQFRDFDRYIWSRRKEDKGILENVISDWLDIINIDKQHVSISYFDKAIATPNKVKLKK
ncbi:helix-turn-helix domain-containing protein [Streptococcus parasanguinis]|uniref:helix-turn-helix domain-containing protein n=1 Tax=Streptococcus parasanguinis TaxID=1318 RepID=UPI002001962D|nr:helix-turn-helix domain-containing protein [Streptococcus parasanguinis]